MRTEQHIPAGGASEDDFDDDMDIDDLEALERTLAAPRHTTSSTASSSTIATNTALATSIPTVIHKDDADTMRRQAAQLALSTLSPSARTTSTATTAVNAPTTVIERMTVSMLRKMLKNDTTDVDTVIVIGQVKKIFKLKVTGMRMRLLARIRDPDTSEDLVVVWTDEVRYHGFRFS